jgi:hypothetical protein
MTHIQERKLQFTGNDGSTNTHGDTILLAMKKQHTWIHNLLGDGGRQQRKTRRLRKLDLDGVHNLDTRHNKTWQGVQTGDSPSRAKRSISSLETTRTPAKAKLREDVKNKKHTTMKPALLQASDPEYLPFKPKKFK